MKGLAGRGHRFRTVHLFHNDRANKHLRFMFKPLTDTLLGGLGAVGVNASLTIVEAKRCDANCFRRALAPVGRRDVFLWIGNPGGVAVPWAEMRSRGAYNVYYQTEPRDGCHLTERDGVDEVWDYSWHNIEVCRRELEASASRAGAMPAQPLPLRYVPPGASVPNPSAARQRVRVFSAAGMRASTQLDGTDGAGGGQKGRTAAAVMAAAARRTFSRAPPPRRDSPSSAPSTDGPTGTCAGST